MADDGIEHVYVFATSAYASYSGCRQYHEDIARARVSVVGGGPTAEKLPHYFDAPGFVQANADALAAALAALPADVRDTARLVATAHSIPDAMAAVAGPDGHAYEAELHGRGRAGRRRGRPGPGVRPGLAEPQRPAVRAVAGARRQRPPAGAGRGAGRRPSSSSRSGFISDHLEVIWDLDNEAQETAAELGLAFARAGDGGHAPGLRGGRSASCWRSAGRRTAAPGHQLPGGLLLRAPAARRD